jgi:hypothetical protein
MTRAPELRVVPEHEVKAMLARHGVAVPRGTTDLSQIETLQEPLVVKGFGEGVVHKSDLGLVELHLDRSGAAKVAERLLQHPDVDGVLVEEQARPFVELLVGVVNGAFGPMLAVGMGGTQTELLDDVSLRALPVDDTDVREMLGELRSAKVLHGYRGGAPTDVAALIGVVLGVCELADALGDELSELECNPVIAGPHGAIAVDARLILRERLVDAPSPRTDFSELYSTHSVEITGASAKKQKFDKRLLKA